MIAQVAPGPVWNDIALPTASPSPTPASSDSITAGDGSDARQLFLHYNQYTREDKP